MISMTCTGSGYTETLVSRLTSVFLLLGSKKNKIELKSGIIHKKTGLLIDAKTTVQHNVFFSKTHHFKGNSLLVSKRLLSLWEFLKIKN